MKTLVILPAAAKSLGKHRAEADRILEKLETLATDPTALANQVKALSGSGALRLRVGNFRVVFEEAESELIVTRIGPRGSVYD